SSVRDSTSAVTGLPFTVREREIFIDTSSDGKRRERSSGMVLPTLLPKRNGGGVRHCAGGRRNQYGVRSFPPAKNALRLSTTSCPIAARVECVALPTCGCSTTLSSASSASGTRGSSA